MAPAHGRASPASAAQRAHVLELVTGFAACASAGNRSVREKEDDAGRLTRGRQIRLAVFEKEEKGDI